MTQEQWAILVFKIAAVGAFVSPLLWVAYYSSQQPWWKDQIGKSLVYNALCSVIEAGVWIVALFFHLQGMSSRIALWVYAGVIGLVTPIMLSRLYVWRLNAGRARAAATRSHCPTCTCTDGHGTGDAAAL